MARRARTPSRTGPRRYVWKNKERTELVTSGSKTQSYDPATGKVLWEMAGQSRRRSLVARRPTTNMLYVGTGGGMGGAGPLVAIRAGATGDITLEGGEKSNDGRRLERRAGRPARWPRRCSTTAASMCSATAAAC